MCMIVLDVVHLLKHDKIFININLIKIDFINIRINQSVNWLEIYKPRYVQNSDI
jgi:hypothetical protein